MIGIDGTTLTGSFLDELPSGICEMKYNGVLYSGDFKEGKICGKGVFTWTNQSD